MSDAHDDGSQSGKIVVSQATLIPIGAVVTLLGLMWMAKSYVDDQFATLNTQIVALVNRMDRADWRSSDPWTATDMRLWVERAARQNQALNLPAVEKTQDR